MKKKLAIFLLALLSCVACVFGFTACGSCDSDKDGANMNENGNGGTSNIAVTSISLSKFALDMKVGESETLIATVSPDNATDPTVIWSSSDNYVAVVVYGRVTALKAGTSIITAKAGNIVASCRVTVNDGTVAVTDVTLNKNALTLEVGGAETLIATIAPQNATDKNIIWSSSDNLTASVVNGKVTALKAGTATITAMAGNKSASCEITVTKKQLRKRWFR